jgi:hypothetical protein
VDAIPGGSNDLAHIQPDAFEALAGKLSAVTRAGNGDAPGLCHVPGLSDNFSGPIIVAALGGTHEHLVTILDIGAAFVQVKLSRVAAGRRWRRASGDVIAGMSEHFNLHETKNTSHIRQLSTGSP